MFWFFCCKCFGGFLLFFMVFLWVCFVFGASSGGYYEFVSLSADVLYLYVFVFGESAADAGYEYLEASGAEEVVVAPEFE